MPTYTLYPRNDKPELVHEDWELPAKPPIYLQAEEGLYWDTLGRLCYAEYNLEPMGSMPDPFLEELLNNYLRHANIKENIALSPEEADKIFTTPTNGEE